MQIFQSNLKKIALFGTPRSGTSWLSQIFNSHPRIALRFQPLFSFEHKGAITRQSSREEIEVFYTNILHSRDDFALMKAPFFSNYPIFTKQNLEAIAFKETLYLDVSKALLENSDAKVIAIVRNPLSVLASWKKAPKEFDKAWDILKEWRDAPSKNSGPAYYYGFNKWIESTLMFHELSEQYPDTFFLVNYAELSGDPLKVTKDIFDFCGLSLDAQTIEFISDSKSRHDDSDPYSVYRSRSSDKAYKNILPKHIIDEVKRDLSGTKLEKYIL